MRALRGERGGSGGSDDLLSQSVRQIRRYGAIMLLLSGAINILGITLPLFTMQVFDRVLSSRSLDTLFFLALAAILALITVACLDGVRSLVLGRIGEWLMQRLGPDVLARSIERRLVDNQLRTEMLREVSQLRGFISGPGVPAMLDVPWMPFYLLIAFLIHPWLGAISLVGMALLFGLAFINEKFNSKDMRAAAAVGVEVLRNGDAIMRNAEVIDSMGMAPQITKRWSRAMYRELRLQDRVHCRGAILVSVTRLTRSVLQVVLYASAALLVLEQQMTGGAMLAGAIIMSRLLAPMESMFLHWRSLMLIREIYGHLQAFFALPPLRSAETSLPRPKGQIMVDRVTIAMPGHPAPILRSVTFTLEPGEHLAIIGPAASGKTTLSRILLGIMRPGQGSVRLDGMDVSKWQRQDLGPHIGYLPQDVELFSGTVAQNIARFTACEDNEIIRAARMAGCHQMILNLPNGYDTEIGEGGVFLSGGQRQQVGLARALFGRPRLVVLDEPNSNLDSNGDTALKAALERLRAMNVTTIVVTHRQSLISHVDKLLFLQNGMVKAFGPVAEVMIRLRNGVKDGEGQISRELPSRQRVERGVKTIAVPKSDEDDEEPDSLDGAQDDTTEVAA
ncbi:MAG: type I secretion system permease/ATPase [Sphingomonadales bacterium]|nr:MAG: type I secretion system permease/ATPase [Sphingomonadales bacterium]